MIEQERMQKIFQKIGELEEGELELLQRILMEARLSVMERVIVGKELITEAALAEQVIARATELVKGVGDDGAESI